jgi:hypothetical protein
MSSLDDIKEICSLVSRAKYLLVRALPPMDEIHETVLYADVLGSLQKAGDKSWQLYDVVERRLKEGV